MRPASRIFSAAPVNAAASVGSSGVVAVGVNPLTRMPWGASSMATDRVKLRRADLAEQ